MKARTLDPRQDYPTLSLVGLAHGTSHFYHLLLPPLFPWLMPAFGLSFTQAGALMTVFFVVSGIGQAGAGFVVDRLGATRVLLAGLATLSAAAVLIGSAHSYAMLIAGAALAGLGNCVFHPADYTILNRRITPDRLGQAFSVHGLAGNAGWVLAPTFLATVAATAGWRVAAFSAAGVGLLTIAVLLQARHLIHVASLALLPSAGMIPGSLGAPGRQSAVAGLAPAAVSVVTDNPRAAAVGAPPWHSRLPAFLAIPAVWLCFGFFLSTSAAFGILQNYVGPLLGHLYGMAPTLAASCLTAYLLGSTAGTAAGGLWAKAGRAHQRTIALALGASALAATLLATQWLPLWTVLPVLAVMGFGVGFTGPSRDLMVRQAATARLGDAVLGRVYGFVYSGLDAGLALGPLLFGPLMDRSAFTAVIAAVAVLQILAILLTRQLTLVSKAV